MHQVLAPVRSQGNHLGLWSIQVSPGLPGLPAAISTTGLTFLFLLSHNPAHLHPAFSMPCVSSVSIVDDGPDCVKLEAPVFL